MQTPWAQWFSQLQPILQSVVASGPTSGRPTQNLYIGYPYFDTTIDQMIYWNGVIWVTYAPSTTGTSILKGNGSGGFNNAVAGVDFAPATSGTAILFGNDAGGFSSVSIGSGVTFAGGVLSATGSGGTVTAVTGSGNIASSGGNTPDITFTGTLPIANGGTNGTATPTAGAVAVGNGTQYAFTAAGSAGQVLTSNGSTVPTWATVATGIGTTGYWGSFWDTTNQTAASTTVAYLITLNSTDADSNGVSIVSSSRITFAYAGAYNLQFSAQFVNTDTQIHNAQVWLRLNGTDVTDSMGTVAIQQKHGGIDGINIVSWNYVLKLSAGDYLQLVWNVDSTNVSLQTLPAGTSPTHPESPSVIVTATPVTEVGIGYYNLTSVSSVVIATGSKTFTTNLSNISTAFTVGTRVRVAYVTTPANYMEGVITSFSGTTLVVNVDSIGGSGTYANWTISVAGIQGSNGVISFSGSSTGLTPATATTGAITLAGILVGANGGTGVANTGKTFTIGGDFTTSGAFTTSLTVTANTSLTLPISGTVISSVTAPAANPITGTPSASTYLRGDGTWATFTTGTVTSVAASVPAFLSISGSPITSSGTLAITLSGTALPVANGGTGLTTLTAGYIPYGNGTGAFNSNIALRFDTALRGSYGAGAITTNFAAGDGTFISNTTGSQNSAVGYQALIRNTTGVQNSAMGAFALYNNTVSSFNLAMGAYALYLNTTGIQNSAAGLQALYSNVTGSYNAAIGLSALFNNTSGAQNSAMGGLALNSNTTGSFNLAMGRQALYDLKTTTIIATAIVNGTAYQIVTMGTTTAAQWIASGALTGTVGETFTANATAGVGTGTVATSADVAIQCLNNTALGYNTGRGITTGSGNTIIGAGVTGLAAGLTNNIILANGTGSVRVQSNATTITFADVIMPKQATTAAAPAYVKGGMYFDTTLNKMRIGGATAWETVTSV